ncbi:MAG: DUF945 family protein [Rhodoferax sp.]|nr:DUF945 family protein [Rhodoferax sp.]
MSTSRRKMVGALLFVLVCTLLALAPWYSARVLESSVRAWVSETQSSLYPLRVRHWEHHAGWLASHGALELEWRRLCGDREAASLGVRVRYQARHLPDGQGWLRLDGAMEPLPDLAAAGGATPVPLRIAVVAHRGFDGVVRARFAVPTWTVHTGWGLMQGAASQAQLEWAGSRLWMAWEGPHMAWAEGGTSPLQAQGIRVQMDWDDATVSRGQATVQVGDLQWAALRLQGLRLDADAVQHDDRISASLTQAADRVGYQSHAMEQQALQLQVKGLHRASVVELGRVLAARCTATGGAAEAAQAVRAAVQKLLASGLSVGVPVARGRMAHSDWQGQLVLSLAPAPTDRVQMTRQLSVQADLQVRGDVSTLATSVLPVPSPYWQERVDGYATAWRYGQGQLQVNGQVLDSARLQWAIDMLDKALTAWLARQDAEPELPHVPVVPPTELPAPVPPEG